MSGRRLSLLWAVTRENEHRDPPLMYSVNGSVNANVEMASRRFTVLSFHHSLLDRWLHYAFPLVDAWFMVLHPF